MPGFPTHPATFPADEALPAGWVGERTPVTGWVYRYDPDYADWLDGMFGEAPAPRTRRSCS